MRFARCTSLSHILLRFTTQNIAYTETLKPEWEKFPEWLFICPHYLLKASYLSKNRVFRHTVIQALSQHVFLRGCSALHFDDTLCQPQFEDLWEAFLNKFLRPKNQPEHPGLKAICQAMLTYGGRAIPKRFQRYFEDKTEERTPIVVRDTKEKIDKTCSPPSIEFGEPTTINVVPLDDELIFSLDTFSNQPILHVVVWEKSNSGNRRNPQIHRFADLSDVRVPKPSRKRFEVTAFWSDENSEFPSQSSLSNVKETAYCDIEIKTRKEPKSRKKTVPKPQPVAATKPSPLKVEEAKADNNTVEDEPQPTIEVQEGESLALCLLEILESESLAQAFSEECIAELRRDKQTENISFTLQKLLRFLNKHGLMEADERRDIANKWRNRTLIIDTNTSKCYCADNTQTPLAKELCGIWVELLFKKDLGATTETRIKEQATIDNDQVEIDNFWAARTEVKTQLEEAIQFFRAFSPTQWQGHTSNYNGEDHRFIWERDSVWEKLRTGKIKGVKELLKSLWDVGIHVKISEQAGTLTFAFHPQGKAVMVKPSDTKKSGNTSTLVPNKGTIMGVAICDQQAAQNNSEIFSTEFITQSSQGWAREAERIGRRIFAALAKIIAEQPKTPMIAARKSASENENLKQQLRSKYLRSLEESATEVFKIPQYDEEGRLIGLKKITNLDDLQPGEKILVRDFVVQIGHEEARATDKKTPAEFATEVETKITESLSGGQLREVDKEALVNPGAAIARQKQRERLYTEVREFMTPRNKKYLLKRIQATINERYPKLKERTGITGHHLKEPIHNQTARGLVYKALEAAGIKPSDFFDPNLTYSELVESFNIDGQCWVEWLIDQLEKKEVTLRPLQEITFSYDQVASIMDDK